MFAAWATPTMLSPGVLTKLWIMACRITSAEWLMPAMCIVAWCPKRGVVRRPSHLTMTLCFGTL